MPFFSNCDPSSSGCICARHMYGICMLTFGVWLQPPAHTPNPQQASTLCTLHNGPSLLQHCYSTYHTKGTNKGNTSTEEALKSLSTCLLCSCAVCQYSILAQLAARLDDKHPPKGSRIVLTPHVLDLEHQHHSCDALDWGCGRVRPALCASMLAAPAWNHKRLQQSRPCQHMAASTHKSNPSDHANIIMILQHWLPALLGQPQPNSCREAAPQQAM